MNVRRDVVFGENLNLPTVHSVQIHRSGSGGRRLVFAPCRMHGFSPGVLFCIEPHISRISTREVPHYSVAYVLEQLGEAVEPERRARWVEHEEVWAKQAYRLPMAFTLVPLSKGFPELLPGLIAEFN